MNANNSTRPLEVAYDGWERSAAYADILANQAAVPSRYRGTLPPTTAFNAAGRLTADGQQAIKALGSIALRVGGSIVWRRSCA